jgi:tetratricopeptide (TPR) repeat protein
MLLAFCWLAPALYGADVPLAQQAKNAMERGAFDEALGIAKRMLAANPRDVNALNIEGLALTGRGDLQQAADRFEAALRIDPGFQPARKNLAIDQLTLKQPEAAEKNLTILLKQTPRDPAIRMYLGELAFRRKEYAAATVHLEAAKPLWPKDARLPVMLAECHFQAGRRPEGVHLLEAIEPGRLDPVWQFHAGVLLAARDEYAAAARFFEAARGRYPQPYDLLFNLGVCYVQTRKLDQAISVLAELRKTGPATSELDNLLAEAYEGNKQTQRAIDLLREATKLAPDEERNYVDLAMLCAEHNSFDLGLEVVDVGLHHVPDSDALLVQRGVIYAMNGRYEEAEKEFQAASHHSAARDSAYTALGLSYIQQGDVGKAVQVLRERAKQDSGNAALQYLLGEALIRTGVGPGDEEYAEALAALEKSVRVNPNFAYSHIDLAKLYLMQNRNAEAIQHLRASVAIDNTSVQAYAQLGAALRKEGKTDEALPMFAKVRELNEHNRTVGEPVPLVRGDANGEGGVRK